MKRTAHVEGNVITLPAALPAGRPPGETSHPGGGRLHRHVWWAAFGAAALVIGAGTAIDLWRRPAPGRAPTLLVAPVTRGRVVGKVQATGRLQPEQVATVSAAVGGRLLDLAVAPGTAVRAGQVLARLDPLAARAELARAESRLVAAEAAAFEAEIALARLVRSADRVRPNLPPRFDEQPDPEEVEEVLAVGEARVARAASEVAAREADYRLARQRGREVAVRAPADGVVLEDLAEPGQTVAAGAALFRLAPALSRLVLVVEVPEAQMKQLAVGGRARFEVPALPGRGYQAQVAAVGRLRGPEAARQVPVTLHPVGELAGLEAGMSAQVVIELASAGPVWRVPLAALTFAPAGSLASLDDPGVYLAPGQGPSAFERIPVEVGVSDGSFAEVRAARLAEGAAVVVGLGTWDAPSPR